MIPDEPHRGQGAQDEPVRQFRVLGQGVGQVRGVGAAHQQHRGQGDREPAEHEADPQLQGTGADGPDPRIEQDGSGIGRQDGRAPAAQRRGEDQRPAALPQQGHSQARQRQEQQFERQRHRRRHPVNGERQDQGDQGDRRELGERVGSGQQRMFAAQAQCVPHGEAPSGS